MPKPIRWMTRAAAFAACMSVASIAAAQATDWPNHTITLILGFAPGGPNDLIARVLAKRLSEQLKQSVVVDNRAGANGNIAAGAVSRAPADGYTFLYNSSSLALSPALYRKPPVDPLRDLAPVNGTATLPLVCVVASDFPASNFKEWAAQLKAHPDKFNYGSPGVGNLAHIAAAMVLKANGLSAVHAPYKGSSEALVGLIEGATQFQFDSVNSPAALIRSGKLKALFVTSNERSPLYPNVPTLAESGARNLDATAWQGVMAPARTPSAVLDRMADEIATAMHSDEVKAALDAQGAYAIASTREQYAAFLGEQTQRFRKTVDDLGLKLD